jgi:hypothetical protein
MRQARRVKLLVAALLVALPAISEAGPPLICHPFQTAGSELLAWGSGPEWNNPARDNDVQRLTVDTLRLLTPETPVLARMENMRRAAIYATQNQRAADSLLQALIQRAGAPNASTAALFDAGYLIESYKQSAHMYRWAPPSQDGYGMVLRAIAKSNGAPAMEFAASLMARGDQAQAHLRRARAGASGQPLLAQNIETHWR